jgi:hypothetical protein
LRLTNLIDSVSTFVTASPRDERSSLLFLKAMMVFALGKVITIWLVADTLYGEFHHTSSRILLKLVLLPLSLAEVNIYAFLGVVTVTLLVLIILKPTYFGNFVFACIVYNVFMLKYPVTNGSDLILLVFAVLSIPFAIQTGDYGRSTIFSNALFNTSRILIQIQVILIYVISGWDKLKNDVWTSGKAFQYIQHIEVTFNPWFKQLLSNNNINVALSWFTIIFELAFGLLVYLKATRRVTLITGVFFHIGIWLMLMLPDFALIMILSYCIFLHDSDWDKLFQKRKTLLK